MTVAFASTGHDVTATIATDLMSAVSVILYRESERAFVVVSPHDASATGRDVITTLTLRDILSEGPPGLDRMSTADVAPSDSRMQSGYDIDELTVAEAIDLVAGRRDVDGIIGAYCHEQLRVPGRRN